MEFMKSPNIVINDDVSAFLTNTYTPHDLVETYTLGELKKNSLCMPNKCSKRRLETLGPIIEGIIGNIEKRQCTRTASNLKEFEKKNKVPEETQDLQSSGYWTSPHYQTRNAHQKKDNNSERVKFPQNITTGKSLLPSSASESSECCNNILPVSSLLGNGKPKSQTIHADCSDVDKTISGSVDELRKNDRKPLESLNLNVKNFKSSLNNSCKVGASKEKCDTPGSECPKCLLPGVKNHSIIQNKTGILHTSAISSQQPKQLFRYLPTIKVHDVLCVDKNSGDHNLLNLKKQLTVDSKVSSSANIAPDNCQVQNFPLPSSNVTESSPEIIVLAVKVLNTSRYGRPLRKRFDLSFSNYCTRNKMINSTDNKNTILKGNQSSKHSQSETSASQNLKNRSQNVTYNFRPKCSTKNAEIFARKQESNDFDLDNNKIIPESNDYKQLSKHSNANGKKFANLQKKIAKNQTTDPAVNAEHLKNGKIKQINPIARKQILKNSGETKRSDAEVSGFSGKKVGSAEDIKMSRFGRKLKKVMLDHYATPGVVREIRSRVSAKCSSPVLFPSHGNSEHSDQLEDDKAMPSCKSKEHHVNKNTKNLSNKLPVKAIKHSSQELLSESKENSSKQNKRGKKTAKNKKEGLSSEKYDEEIEHSSQKRQPAHKQSSRRNNRTVDPEAEKVTARKGTLKYLQQRHKRQQVLLLQQQQQEDDAAELLAENPHLLPRNKFRMHDLLQSMSSPSGSSNRARDSSTPIKTVDSSSLLPTLSPVSPFCSASVSGLSFSTPRSHGDWHWLKDTPATTRSSSPEYGGNCNLLLTPVVPNTEDVHRIIYNKNKGRRGKKKFSRLADKEADAPPTDCRGTPVSKARSKVRHKGKDFEWLELPSNPASDNTDNDEESKDEYFGDSF